MRIQSQRETFAYRIAGIQIEPDPTGSNAGDAAQAWDGDKLVGNLTWGGKNSTRPGTLPAVQYVAVHPDYRHQGIATNMINWVRENMEPDLDFNDWLSRSGKGLAESMGYQLKKPKEWEPDTSDADDDEWLPGGRFDTTRQDVEDEVRHWQQRMPKSS